MIDENTRHMVLSDLRRLDEHLKIFERMYSNRDKKQSRALETVMLEVATRIYAAEDYRRQLRAEVEQEHAEDTAEGWANKPPYHPYPGEF
jgi:hypothetical protein